jgi:hypothetical protein
VDELSPSQVGGPLIVGAFQTSANSSKLLFILLHGAVLESEIRFAIAARRISTSERPINVERVSKENADTE